MEQQGEQEAMEEDEVNLLPPHLLLLRLLQVPTRVFLRRQADLLLNMKQKKGGRR